MSKNKFKILNDLNKNVFAIRLSNKSQFIKMTTYALDAEMFINEIKKYKELWSLSCDGYRFKAKDKQLAWANVARAFIPDFDSMKEVEKGEVYRKLHCKWRNIRDAYVRNLKRKDGKRAYMYAKLLTFLNTRYADNRNSEGDSENESSDEVESVSMNKSRNIEVAATSEDDESSTIENLKRRRVEKTEKIEFVDTPNVQSESTHVSEDDDRSFFESLLPAVREFDLDQKLEFRCGVLKLIKQFRSQGTNLKVELNSLDYD